MAQSTAIRLLTESAVSKQSGERNLWFTRYLWRRSSQVVKRGHSESFINANDSALTVKKHRGIAQALRWAESTHNLYGCRTHLSQLQDVYLEPNV